MSRLSELGKAARLAGVGDRVDFVVTLGSGPNESSGRLERQTRSGTVAIREYRDARCEQVAEALALTLDLALEPEAAPAAGGASPSASSNSAVAASPGPMATAARSGGLVALARGEPAQPDAAAARGASLDEGATRAPRVAVGAQASITTGIAPGALPGGTLFVEGGFGSEMLASWRASLFGAYRESTARQREIEVLLVGVRLEGCPLALRHDPIAFTPCVGLDAGLLRAAGPSALGVTDAGFWSAAAAHGRLATELGAGVSLELQAGGLVPLVRYEMGAGDAAWFRTRTVGLAASLGAAWRIP